MIKIHWFWGAIWISLFITIVLYWTNSKTYKSGFIDGVQSRINYEHGKEDGNAQ
jgi:hypothetical protein